MLKNLSFFGAGLTKFYLINLTNAFYCGVVDRISVSCENALALEHSILGLEKIMKLAQIFCQVQNAYSVF